MQPELVSFNFTVYEIHRLAPNCSVFFVRARKSPKKLWRGFLNYDSTPAKKRIAAENEYFEVSKMEELDIIRIHSLRAVDYKKAKR